MNYIFIYIYIYTHTPPLVDESIQTMWYSHIIEYYLFMKIQKEMKYGCMWQHGWILKAWHILRDYLHGSIKWNAQNGQIYGDGK